MKEVRFLLLQRYIFEGALTFYFILFFIAKWANLLTALFECSQSPNAAHRESAFRIFASVPDLIADQPTDAVKNVFMRSLTDPESQAVSIILKKGGGGGLQKTEN